MHLEFIDPIPFPCKLWCTLIAQKCTCKFNNSLQGTLQLRLCIKINATVPLYREISQV